MLPTLTPITNTNPPILERVFMVMNYIVNNFFTICLGKLMKI